MAEETLESGASGGGSRGDAVLNFVSRFCCGTQEWCWKLSFLEKKNQEKLPWNGERFQLEGNILPSSCSCILYPWKKKPERRNCVKIEAVGVLEKGSRGICNLAAVM